MQISSQQNKDAAQAFLDGKGAVSTQTGLAKNSNEDAVGYIFDKNGCIRIAIADGHWGQEAAALSVKHWLEAPLNKNPALCMKELESTLAKRFAVPSPDPNTTRTPETSVLVATIYPDNRMEVVGYGDCRLSVVRNGHSIYRYDTKATWLGLFSFLSLRDRLPVDKGTTINSVELRKGDVVLLYSDGVDECVYETPTLDVESLVAQDTTPAQICDVIMSEVFSHGAEDNASIVALKI